MREGFRKVRELFEAALEVDENKRRQWLRDACAGDAELEREVWTLLDANQQTGFLDAPLVPREVEEQAPARFGPYEVLEEIGQGGMGTVYRAVRVDDAFRKVVAVKVIGGIGPRSGMAERFQRERQILARLEHQNIARILDGGSERGIPYLVMEYVEGERIDAYCEGRKLEVRERLRLLAQLCDAADYAHRNLVVHRDIKPGNVLVTAEGVVKLLDFGIAKMMDPGQEVSLTQTMQMTPDYASPEQIRGEPVTPASDVYAIGVILYQLLTGGGLPRRTTGNLAELVKAVSEEEAPLPSSKAPVEWRRQLRGDLDCIARAALALEQERRYPTAGRLGDDLHRFLDGEPVWAHADSVLYRARKFARRHWVLLAATSAVIVSLGVGIVTTARQRALAEKRYQDVRALATTVLFDIHDQIKGLAGATEARRIAVSKALQYLDSLYAQSHGDLELQAELAAAYERSGDILGNISDSAAEGAQASLPLYRKALELRKQVAAARPGDGKSREALAKAHELVGVGHLGLGQAKDAIASFETARQVFGEGLFRAEMLDRLAAGHMLMGGFDRALEYSSAAMKMLGADAPKRLVARMTRTHGIVLRLMGRNAEAVGDLEKAARMLAELMREKPDEVNFQRSYATMLPMLARAYEDLGRRGEADRVWGNAREELTRIAANAGADPQVLLSLAYALKHISRNYYEAYQAGKGKQTGEEELALSLTYSGRLAGREKAGATELTEYADTLLHAPYAKLRNPKRALECALRANELSLGRNPLMLDTLALAYFRNGDRAKAIATMEKALSLLPAGEGGAKFRKEFEEALREFRKGG